MIYDVISSLFVLIKKLAFFNKQLQGFIITLNSIFPIIVPAGKYTLKPINSCIKTWFQIFPQITKKAQKWVYSYQSRISLLSLNMFDSLLLCLSRWFRAFICLLEWLLEEPLRSVRICAYHL